MATEGEGQGQIKQFASKARSKTPNIRSKSPQARLNSGIYKSSRDREERQE